MSETGKPILFSGSMVLALLDGRKSQTRRIIKPEPASSKAREGSTLILSGEDFVRQVVGHFRLKHAVGDRLWVREAWRSMTQWDGAAPRDIIPGPVRYEADPCVAHSFGKLRPSMFMPRWASRLTLTVTNVRVERLQDISEADAIAEGIHHVEVIRSGERQPDEYHLYSKAARYDTTPDPIASYRSLWNVINGPGSWDTNPWVVATSFAVERRNIDAPASQAAA